MRSLKAKAAFGITFLAIVMGLMLFIAAGTIRFGQAWGYLAAFFGATRKSRDRKKYHVWPYAVVRHPMYAGSFLYLLDPWVSLGTAVASQRKLLVTLRHKSSE